MYRRFNPQISRYLTVEAADEAEDIASEVWISLSRQLPKFEGDESGFRALLFTIARSRLQDFRRKSARQKTTPVSNEAMAATESGEDIEDQALTHVRAVEAARRLVAELPADQADIVLLRVVAGLSAEEVGEVLDKTPGAVRVAQYRALQHLSEVFGPEIAEQVSSQATLSNPIPDKDNN